MIKRFIIIESPISEHVGRNIVVETVVSTVNDIEELGRYRTTMFNGRDVQLESENPPHITLRGTLKRN